MKTKTILFILVLALPLPQAAQADRGPHELFPKLDLDPIEIGAPDNLSMITTNELRFEFVYPRGADLMVIAVFKSLPQSGKRITNMNDIVWLWHSELDPDEYEETVGEVLWERGRGLGWDPDVVIDQTMVTSGTPAKPNKGVFHWAAWAWKGKDLSHSSVIKTFSVGPETITGRDCPCPKSITRPRCIEPQYRCAILCTTDADCYEGTHCENTSTCLRAGDCICLDRDECPQCDPMEEYCDQKFKDCLRINDAEGAGCGCQSSENRFAFLGILVLVVLLAGRFRGSIGA